MFDNILIINMSYNNNHNNVCNVKNTRQKQNVGQYVSNTQLCPKWYQSTYKCKHPHLSPLPLEHYIGLGVWTHLKYNVWNQNQICFIGLLWCIQCTHKHIRGINLQSVPLVVLVAILILLCIADPMILFQGYQTKKQTTNVQDTRIIWFS